MAEGVVVVPLQSSLVTAYRLVAAGRAWNVELAPVQPLAADGGLVYVPARDGVHALRAADGSTVWMAPVGSATAPLLAQQGWVIVATEGQLTALRSADGSVVWTRETGPQGERASFEGDHLYVPLTDGRLLALDLKTGMPKWQHKFGGAPTEVLALADRIYLGCADKRLYALDAGDGDVKWKQDVRAPLRGQPAVSGDHVIIVADTNELRAFDRHHGAMRWRQGLPFRPTAGPTVIGTAVLAPGIAAELRAYDAASHREAGTIKFGKPLAAPFAAAQVQGSTVLAALTGTLTEEWTLVLMQVPPHLPSLGVETDFTLGNWQAGMESISIR